MTAGATATTAGAASGRDTTAPTTTEARPGPRAHGPGAAIDRIPLGAFYDQQRYGYLFQSEDQEFELRVNTLLQADARIYPQREPEPGRQRHRHPPDARSISAAG